MADARTWRSDTLSRTASLMETLSVRVAWWGYDVRVGPSDVDAEADDGHGGGWCERVSRKGKSGLLFNKVDHTHAAVAASAKF